VPIWDPQPIFLLFHKMIFRKFLVCSSQSQSQSYLTTESQLTSLSWCQATILDPWPIFLSPPRKLSSDSCIYFSMGRPLWWEDGSMITHTIVTLSFQCCHCLVHIPQTLIPYPIISFETRFPFCPLLWVAGWQWKYSNPPAHGEVSSTSGCVFLILLWLDQ
jgi:hypothetical protein